MSGYDPTLACRLLRASICAYLIDKKGNLNGAGDPYYESMKFTHVKAFAAGLDGIDAAFVGVTADEIILSFRGTLPLDTQDGADKFIQSLLDWLNDADAPLVPAPDGIPGKVHKGFNRAVDVMWGSILAELKAQWPSKGSRKFYVTGHSKGGATAQLAAMRALKAGMVADAVYTYAGARIGNGEFANAFNHSFPRAWRFEYQDDIVPHVPPSNALLAPLAQIFPKLKEVEAKGYESAGTLQFINWSGGIQGDSHFLEWERGLAIGKLLLKGKEGLAVIAADHACRGGYYQTLCK